jgi:hypothetical protein
MVLLFIGSVVITVMLVLGGTAFAIWHGQNSLTANNLQWCTALTDLTKVPVPAPADPSKNPSREFSYRLYTDFKGLEEKFGCRL